MESSLTPTLEICRGRALRPKQGDRLNTIALDLGASVMRFQWTLDSLMGEVGHCVTMTDQVELHERLTDALQRLEQLSSDMRRYGAALGTELPDPALFGAAPEAPLSEGWKGP